MKLTKNQYTWLKRATDKEKRAFMKKGPAEVKMFFDRETGDLSFAPAVRWLQVGETVENIDKAQKYAEDFLGELQKEDLPILQERSLGIDGSCVMQTEICFEKNLRIEGIIHLGSLLATKAFESRCFENLHDEFIDALVYEGVEVEASMKPLRPSFNNEDVANDLNSFVADYLISNSFYGFAVSISCPVKRYYSKISAGYSWGHKHKSWVYGESFEEAFKYATAWVHRMNKKDLDKFKFKYGK